MVIVLLEPLICSPFFFFVFVFLFLFFSGISGISDISDISGIMLNLVEGSITKVCLPGKMTSSMMTYLMENDDVTHFQGPWLPQQL